MSATGPKVIVVLFVFVYVIWRWFVLWKSGSVCENVLNLVDVLSVLVVLL